MTDSPTLVDRLRKADDPLQALLLCDELKRKLWEEHR